MNIIEQVESWVNSCIGNSVILDHHYRTRDYLLRIRPDASVEAQIAALTHDVERSLDDSVPVPENNDDYGGAYLIEHGKKSAEAVLDFVRSLDVELDFEKLEYLIVNHEVGGSGECDDLRDADSISFLEVVVPFFLEKYPKNVSRHRYKFEDTFARIGGHEARELARPLYEKAMRLCG